MKILLTGITGFIGKNISKELTDFMVLSPRSLELNLLDKNSLISYVKSNKIDIIVDCTGGNAYPSPGKDWHIEMKRKIQMFFNITCCSKSVDKIIYYGSGAEFDRASMGPRTNEDCFGSNIPEDEYGMYKYINCLQARQYPNIYNLRAFGVFGPHEDPKRFISYCINEALLNKTIAINQNRIFDYLDVYDLAKITGLFIKNDFKHKEYNVCIGRGIELCEIARKVVRIVGSTSKIKVEEPGMGREYTGDNSRLLSETKYQFEITDTSIERLIEWWKSSKSKVSS